MRLCRRSGVVVPPAPDYHSPMLSWAFKHATQLCFSLMLDQQQRSQPSAFSASSGGSLLPQLATALRSERYEVRGAALKVILRHVQQQRQAAAAAPGQQQAAGGSVRQAAALRGLLKQQLQQETHHKALRRLLALLALLPPAAGAGGSQGAADVRAEFSAMLALASQAPDSRVRQYAVECLGPLLSQLLEQQGGLPASSDCMVAGAASQLLSIVGQCSQPTQLPDLRLAAATAVTTSGLLGVDVQQSEAAAEAAAGAWDALLVLLEDEEEHVRQVAARAAVAAMGSFATSGCSSGDAAAAAAAEPAAPSEDWVLRRTFCALAAHFSRHPALLALLCRRCCPSAAAEVEPLRCGDLAAGGAVAAAATAAAAADRAERIFDPEKDNTYEEPLLLTQVCGILPLCLSSGLHPLLYPLLLLAQCCYGVSADRCLLLALVSPLLADSQCPRPPPPPPFV